MTAEQQKERKRLIAKLLLACEALSVGRDGVICTIEEISVEVDAVVSAYRDIVEHSGRSAIMEIEE